MERRDFCDPVTVEERGDGRRMFRGYAAVYDSLSQDLGGFRELLLPGAFDAVLSRKFDGPGRPSAAARRATDCVALWNHDPGQLLGRTSSGTLTLSSDARGLAFEIEPPDTQLARDLASLVARGDVYGSSFAFSVSPEDESYAYDDDGQTIRTIRSVAGLYDVSLVCTPAYLNTEAALRSVEEFRGRTIRQELAAARSGDGEHWRRVVARSVAARVKAEAAKRNAFRKGGRG